MVDMVRKSEDPRVALVHQLPFYSDQRGFMNAIEKVSIYPSRLVIFLNFQCFNGNLRWLVFCFI